MDRKLKLMKQDTTCLTPTWKESDWVFQTKLRKQKKVKAFPVDDQDLQKYIGQINSLKGADKVDFFSLLSGNDNSKKTVKIVNYIRKVGIHANVGNAGSGYSATLQTILVHLPYAIQMMGEDDAMEGTILPTDEEYLTTAYKFYLTYFSDAPSWFAPIYDRLISFYRHNDFVGSFHLWIKNIVLLSKGLTQWPCT